MSKRQRDSAEEEDLTEGRDNPIPPIPVPEGEEIPDFIDEFMTAVIACQGGSVSDFFTHEQLVKLSEGFAATVQANQVGQEELSVRVLRFVHDCQDEADLAKLTLGCVILSTAFKVGKKRAVARADALHAKFTFLEELERMNNRYLQIRLERNATHGLYIDRIWRLVQEQILMVEKEKTGVPGVPQRNHLQRLSLFPQPEDVVRKQQQEDVLADLADQINMAAVAVSQLDAKLQRFDRADAARERARLDAEYLL